MSTLFEMRKKSGLSQKDLAQKAGVARSSIIRWEKHGIAKKCNIEKLARVLGVASSELN